MVKKYTAAVLADLPERYSVSVPPVTNNIYRSAAPAQNYLPERRSAAFRHHYSPEKRIKNLEKMERGRMQRLPKFLGYPLLSRERVKLRTTNLAGTFKGSISIKVY